MSILLLGLSRQVPSRYHSLRAWVFIGCCSLPSGDSCLQSITCSPGFREGLWAMCPLRDPSSPPHTTELSIAPKPRRHQPRFPEAEGDVVRYVAPSPIPMCRHRVVTILSGGSRRQLAVFPTVLASWKLSASSTNIFTPIPPFSIAHVARFLLPDSLI